MPDCSQLCDLMTTSLLRYIEQTSIVILNKETEKNLLLSLSQVSKEIKKWTGKTHSASAEESPEKALSDCSCCQHLVKSCTDVNNCLANIVSLLVPFLGFDRKFVHHLAGNILISVAGLLFQSGSKWGEYIHFLCDTIEILVLNIYSSMPASSPVGSSIVMDERLIHLYQLEREVSCKHGSNIDFTKFSALLQSRLVNADLFMVASLFRILRNILKYLEHDSNDCQGVFMNLAISLLVKLPWALLSKIHVGEVGRSEVSCVMDEFPGKRICLEGQMDVLLGSVLQLLCSFSKKGGEYSAEAFEEPAIYTKVADLVPKLLSSCFGQHLGYNGKCLSHYLGHKVLVLMIRLSSYKHWKGSYPALWLKLLKEHFEDLLCEPISRCDFGFESCLHGSPFLASFVDTDKQYPCARHLQRLAIFLLFRCCFTLAVISKDSSQRCVCVVEPSSFKEARLCTEDCRLNGVSELFEWLQSCGLMENIVDYESYSETCSSFAMSFLQLYIEDDNMLFEMLLQLLDAPLFAKQIQSSGNGLSFEDKRENIYSLLLSIFNPVRLFHLFLLLIRYDHSVLVDYLISKDTGILCVQYLLRCLRKICSSWMTFVRFSISGNDVNQPSQKRKKISKDEDSSRKLRPLSSLSEVAKRKYSRRHKQESVVSVDSRNFMRNRKYAGYITSSILVIWLNTFLCSRFLESSTTSAEALSTSSRKPSNVNCFIRESCSWLFILDSHSPPEKNACSRKDAYVIILLC